MAASIGEKISSFGTIQPIFRFGIIDCPAGCHGNQQKTYKKTNGQVYLESLIYKVLFSHLPFTHALLLFI